MAGTVEGSPFPSGNLAASVVERLSWSWQAYGLDVGFQHERRVQEEKREVIGSGRVFKGLVHYDPVHLALLSQGSWQPRGQFQGTSSDQNVGLGLAYQEVASGQD